MNAEGAGDHLLVLQCDSGDENATMIASARYNIAEQHHEAVRRTPDGSECRKHVILIVHLPRKRGGCFTGFEVRLAIKFELLEEWLVKVFMLVSGRKMAIISH